MSPQGLLVTDAAPGGFPTPAGGGAPPVPPGGEEGQWVPRRTRGAREGRPAGYVPAPRKFRDAAKTFVVSFAAVFAVFTVVQMFLVQLFVIPSESMEDTLQVGDRIAVWKLAGEPARGDIVVFSDPGGWLAGQPRPAPNLYATLMSKIHLAPDPDTGYLVKRVIGVAGDRVQCCTPEGMIVVNGEPQVEPYVKPGARSDQIVFDVTVPQGSVFVMGDNRGRSADSRYHMVENSGAVPVGNIIGKEFLTVG